MEAQLELFHDGKTWILDIMPFSHQIKGDESYIKLNISDQQAELLKEAGIPVF